MDLSRLARKLAEFRVPGLIETHLVTGINGDFNALWVGGCRNRRYEPVFELYRWLAQESAANFGLLYANDAESEFDNEYRVWRLCRGTLTEHADGLLSPIIPTVEDPYDHDWRSG